MTPLFSTCNEVQVVHMYGAGMPKTDVLLTKRIIFYIRNYHEMSTHKSYATIETSRID